MINDNEDSIPAIRKQLEFNPQAIKQANNQIIRGVDWQTTWVREVIFNCIQAALRFLRSNPSYSGSLLSKSKKALVKIRSLPVPDLLGSEWVPKKSANKLSFLNPGGMTKLELEKFCKTLFLSSENTGRKENYGLGERINLLNFTQYLKISHKNGQTHYILVGVDDPEADVPEYGIRNNVNNNCCTVWANEVAEERGYDMSEGAEWTETVLVGYQPNQHTVRDPMGNERVPLNYYTKKIVQRLAKIPENVEIMYAEKTTTNTDDDVHGAGRDKKKTHGYGHGHVYYTSLEDVVATAQKAYLKEENLDPKYKPRIISVPTSKGNILYGYDTKFGRKGKDNRSWIVAHAKSQINNVFSSVNWGKKDMPERFDITEGLKWKNLATRFGIRAEHNNFFIQIDLPFEEYENQYSRSVLNKASKRINKRNIDPVTLEQFREVIIENFPDEIKELIEEHNRDAMSVEDTDDYALQIFKRNNPHLDWDNAKTGKNPDTKERRPGKSGKPSKKPKAKKGQIKPREFKNTQPSSSEFDNIKVMEDLSLNDAFVNYIPDGNGGENDCLYYNPEHSCIDALVEHTIERLYEIKTNDPWYVDENKDEVRRIATRVLIGKAKSWIRTRQIHKYQNKIDEEQYQTLISQLVLSESTATGFGVEADILFGKIRVLCKAPNTVDEIKTQPGSDGNLKELQKKWKNNPSVKLPEPELS